MGFNYAKEKKQFDLEWKMLQKEYENAGMALSAIETMRSYDWDTFLSRRTYENHTQPLPDTFLSGEVECQQSKLFKKFSSLSTVFDEKSFSGRYAWIDAIGNIALSAKLAKLTANDLELLTLYAIDGYTQTEIAIILNRDQSVISRKIKRIKNFLKK